MPRAFAASPRFVAFAVLAATTAACTLLVDTSGLAGAAAASADGGESDGASAVDGAGEGGPPPEAGPDGAPASAYRAAVLADAPLVYWRMGIASGTVIPDETGGGNDLVLTGGGETLGAPGAIAGDADTAITFDGTHTYAKAKDARPFDFTGTAPFSVEAWVARRPPSGGEYEHLVGQSTGGGASRGGFILYLDSPSGGSADLAFEWDTGTPPQNGANGGTIAVGGYHHCVGTFDGASVRAYIDGELVSAEAVTAGGLPARSSDLLVGADDDLSDMLAGTLDEIAIYGAALPPARVARHASLGRGP